MDQSLLQTKFHIPTIPREFIDRPALYAKMDGIRDRKLCWISTPAGYGKTLLIAAWAKRRGLPLVWISLDPGDDQFSRFFAYVVAAVQRHAPGFGQGLVERLTSPQGMSHELFFAILVNAFDRMEKDCFLVLDDYHVIHSAEIHESIQYLLDRLPSPVHLVITSREEPPFSIAKLRARSQLVEIQFTDLRFSEAQAGEYLNQTIGLDLTEREIRRLVESTEGWIVGLRLAALSLQGNAKRDSFLAQLESANRHISAFFFDEVLIRQPDEIRSFLVRTSVLDRFTASLCDAVLESHSSAALIAQVEHSHLFVIPLDNQQRWYRYHHKFAELLCDRLKRTESELIATLWRRASAWFENEGLLEDAIDYAIRAQDYAHAAQLMDRIGKRLFWTGDVRQMLNWLRLLPEWVYHKYPSLWLLHLWSHVTLAEFSAVAEDLAHPPSSELAADIPDPQARHSYECGLAVIHALTSINYRYDVVAGLAHAERGVDDPDRQSVSYTMAPLIYGKACMLNGDLDRAQRRLDESSSMMDEARNPFMQMVVAHHRAELAFYRGDLERNERLLKEAHQIGKAHHLDDASAFSRICIDIGRLEYERNRLASARQFLVTGISGAEHSWIAYDLIDGYCALFDLAHLYRQTARADRLVASTEFLAKNSGYADAVLRRAESMRVRTAMMKRDLHPVREWLEKLGPEANFGFSDRFEARTAVQALVALKEFERARVLLHRLLVSAERNQCLLDIVHYRCWLARVLYHQVSLRPALLALQKAVRISAHRLFVRSVIDVGDPIGDLLESMQREPPQEWESSSVSDYLAVLIDAYSSTRVESDSPAWPSTLDSVSEPLTEREIATLTLLATGLSNQELADALVISPSTVKFHLKNIYIKLGVHTRTQATLRARELYLV